MIPYNDISYLNHSQTGQFSSYIGHMNINNHHVSTCIDDQYIQEDSQFIAVSIDEAQRDTTVFHFSFSEIDRLASLSPPTDKIDECETCSSEHQTGLSLRASTFSKSATFHDTRDLCLSCIQDMQTALEFEGHSIETELVKTYI